MDENSIAAFWSKVDIKGLTDCWEWRGAKKPKGYGNVTINKTCELAHRVAWSLSNFPAPHGYRVMHVCDNPPCCNPGHLVLGTNLSNFCDMLMKNRQEFRKNKAIGVRNTNAKLNDEKVREIRRIYESGEQNQYELAAAYGVSQVNIGSIVRRSIWKHVE